MEEREVRRKRERKRWREKGQADQIRRQSGAISQGEDF